MGLAEVLVAGAVGGVIIAGSMKSLSLSLQSAQVVKSSLSEFDLRFSIGQVLGVKEDCKANFEPKTANLPTSQAFGLYGDDREWGRGEVVKLVKNAGTTATEDDQTLLEKGEAFKGDLTIVKMELKGSTATGDTNNPKKNKVTRTFVVYYKKEGMGSYSTLAGADCTTSDQRGCYFNQCQVSYQVEDKSNPKVTSCEVSDCVNYGSGGRGANCYQADQIDSQLRPGSFSNILQNPQNYGRALVGCGGTELVKGSRSTFFGFGAGKNTSETLTSAITNTFIGYKAGNANVSGSYSTFLGYEAGLKSTADSNTFIGYRSGQETTTGKFNSFMGLDAGKSNTTGERNTFLGYSTGSKNTIGKTNTFVGSLAGERNVSGNYNVFLGPNAGKRNVSGKRNIAIGNDAGSFPYSDLDLLNAGQLKPTKRGTGNDNIYFGNKAGYHNTTGQYNIFSGNETGYNNTTGSCNVFLGYQVGKENTTGEKNIFIGYQAGHNTSADKTATPDKEASNNIFIGNEAGYSNTDGYRGTFVGDEAGYENTTGKGNSFFGYNTGHKNTTGDYNSFFGYEAGYNSTTGDRNSFFGYNTGRANTTGGYSSYFGYQAGFQNTTGSYNTFIGDNAGYSNTTGDVNTFLGHDSGEFNTTGYYNIFIGRRAGYQNTTGHNNLFIGNNAADHSDYISASNKFVVGNLSAKTWIKGTFGTDTLSVNGKRVCLQGGPHCSSPSSRVYKKNIKPFSNFEQSLNYILDTPLWTYQYKEDHPNKTRMGVISEELPDFLQIKDKEAPSRPDWVSIYGTLWGAIKALFQNQKQQDETIQQLKSLLTKQGQDIEYLKAEIQKLKTQLEQQQKTLIK